MGTSDWMNLIAAILVGGGTLALAFMTWKSIRQTRCIQKAEKREGLLNETIEWAINVTRANFGGEIIVTSGLSEKIQRRRDAVNRLLACQLLTVKGKEMVEPIALSINEELSDAVKEVLTTLDVVLGILSSGVPYSDSKEAKDALRANDSVMEENLRVLINKTSRYRIKGMSQN